MLWKLIVPAIDAGYDDLADILALTSWMLNLASQIFVEELEAMELAWDEAAQAI